MLALYGPEHIPACTCSSCIPQQERLADGLSTAWQKIPVSVESDFLEGVWDQTILPARLHEGLWTEHFTRLRRYAEAGWGKPFQEPTDLIEWQRFQTMQENLRRFAAHKQHTMIEELRDLKAKGLSRADWESKAAGVLRRHNKLYLKAELQATTAAAQAAESWPEFERRKYLYPNLKYVTAHDERVRESHRALDGVIRAVDDPFWNTHAPPLGWGCRCKLIQTDEAVTSGEDLSGLKIPKGFRHNPGKTSQVFDQEHPYFNVAALDREALDRQAAEFHATITKGESVTWSGNNLVDVWRGKWGLPTSVTVNAGEVQAITSGPHIEAAHRNELLYALALLAGNMRYLGQVAGTGPISTFYYYMFMSGGIDYYMTLAAMKDGETDRIGIQAITDKPPNFSGP